MLSSSEMSIFIFYPTQIEYSKKVWLIISKQSSYLLDSQLHLLFSIKQKKIASSYDSSQSNVSHRKRQFFYLVFK